MELGPALARNDSAVVVSLGDEERRAVSLTATLDRASAEAVEINTAMPVDPAKGTHVTNEDFVLRQLKRHNAT